MLVPALFPMTVFSLPVVIKAPASSPRAVLEPPVVFDRGIITNGRVKVEPVLLLNS